MKRTLIGLLIGIVLAIPLLGFTRLPNHHGHTPRVTERACAVGTHHGSQHRLPSGPWGPCVLTD